MDHFFTRNSMGRVFGFLEVSSVRKNWKIYPNFKIPEIFGFLDLGLSLEPDTWLYLFGHGISQTQPMWGHTQNFSSFGPLILHLPGGGWISPPPSLKCGAGTPSLLGLRWHRSSISSGNLSPKKGVFKMHFIQFNVIYPYYWGGVLGTVQITVKYVQTHIYKLFWHHFSLYFETMLILFNWGFP